MKPHDWITTVLLLCAIGIILIYVSHWYGVVSVEAAEAGVLPDATIDVSDGFDIRLYEVKVNGRTCVVAKSDGIALFCEEKR